MSKQNRYRHRRIPDRSLSHRLYSRLRDLTHERIDCLQIGASLHLSPSAYEELKRQVPAQVAGGVSTFNSMRVIVTDTLPYWRKRRKLRRKQVPA